tara:strand:- start:335 stop:790 length:456 start_codon:yes stop_codon:yes gene_type:complete
MKRIAAIATAVTLCASPALSQENDAGTRPALGMAGVLSSANSENLPPITLSAGIPITKGPWMLTSGTYYEFEITADGSQELGLVGPEFFRAIWIDEIVIEGLEIRPLGLNSVEFDEPGTMEIGFVAIKPGTYYMKIPGTTGDTQRINITIQ